MSQRNASTVSARASLIAATVLSWLSLAVYIAALAIIIVSVAEADEDGYDDDDGEDSSYGIGAIIGVAVGVVIASIMTIFLTIVTAKLAKRQTRAHPFGNSTRSVAITLLILAVLNLIWDIAGIALAVSAGTYVSIGGSIAGFIFCSLCLSAGIKLLRSGNGPEYAMVGQTDTTLPMAVSYSPTGQYNVQAYTTTPQSAFAPQTPASYFPAQGVTPSFIQTQQPYSNFPVQFQQGVETPTQGFAGSQVNLQAQPNRKNPLFG